MSAVQVFHFGRAYAPLQDGPTRMMAERIRLHIRQRVSGAMAEAARFEMLPRVSDEMAFMLTAHVYAMPTVKVDYDAKWPADWWQAVKDRWAPRWLLRRWPVEYREVWCHFTQYGGVCPHLEGDPAAKHLEWMANSQRPLPPDIKLPDP